MLFYCLLAVEPHKPLLKQWMHVDGVSSLFLNLCLLDKSFDFLEQRQGLPSTGRLTGCSLAVAWQLNYLKAAELKQHVRELGMGRW